MLAFVKLNPDDVQLEPGFTRDVRNVGHYGTGDLEISMRTPDDLLKAMPPLPAGLRGRLAEERVSSKLAC